MKQAIIDKLCRIPGENKVRTDETLLKERRHDYSMLSQLEDTQGRGAPDPACVVLPEDTEDVVKIVNTCRENKAVVIPFGLGSGVCCGVRATPEAVLLDMSSKKSIRTIDKHNLIATFEAGGGGQGGYDAGPLSTIHRRQFRGRLGRHPGLRTVFQRLRQHRKRGHGAGGRSAQC